MKTLFLLFLFFLPNLAFAQDYPPDSNSYCNMVPYYDYAVCAKGLKDTSGNVLLEPRYSEIHLLPNDLLLVCENDTYGVLNCDFEIFIPIIYKRLQFVPKYYKEVRCTAYYWFFETNEGSGMMNSALEVVFPAVYDHIDRVFLESQESEFFYSPRGYGVIPETALFFRLTLNDKSSIHTEFGKVIVSDRFNEIKCHGEYYPTAPSPKLPNGIFFLAKDDSTQTVISENGDELYKTSIDAKFLVFSVDSSTVIKTTEGERMNQAFCLESGVSTSKEACTIIDDDYFMYQIFDDETFHVYGKNLRLLHRGQKWRMKSEQLTVKDKSFAKLTTGDKRTTLFFRNGNVLLQTEGAIFKTEDETRGFIWTVPALQEGQADTLRIYFPNGKLKHEYVIRGIQINRFFEKRRPRSYSEKFDDLLFIQRGSKWGALDRNGDLKIPFSHDHAGIPFGRIDYDQGTIEEEHISGYYITKAGKMGIIDRFGSKQYACKYDTLFSGKLDVKNNPSFKTDQRPEYFYIDINYYCSFAIRKNTLYTFVEGKERVCDSSFFTFDGPLQLVGDALIDVRGKVIREIEDGTIHKSPKFFLLIKEDVAQVIQLTGKTGLTIDNFKSAQVEGNYLKIKLKDETVGVISLDGSKWLYPPIYYAISFTTFPSTHVWVKEDTLQTISQYTMKRLETYDGRWMLVDTSYEQLYDFPFKFPVDLMKAPYAVFESENRLGMIDSSLNLIFPPIYKIISPIKHTEYVILYKDSTWQLGHSSGVVFDQHFGGISDKEVNKSIAVFSFNERESAIGFLKFDDGFKWAVPMTEIDELINTTSLRTALGTDVSLRLSPIGLHNPVDSLDLWRTQNNELIVNLSLHHQCHIRSLRFSVVEFIPDFEFCSPYTVSQDQQFFESVHWRSRVTTVKSSFNNPEELKEFDNTAYSPKCSWPTFYNQEVFSSSILSYCYSYDRVEAIENYVYLDSVQRVELSDILVRNEQTSAFLQDFVLREFTENQSYGEVCPDLVKTEELMWSNFAFISGGISFPDLKLFLSYEEFAPHLTPLGKRLNPWYSEPFIDE